jgi:hypothetical protein
MKLFRSPWCACWLTALVVLGALLLWWVQPPIKIFALMREGGPIESLTEWTYLGAMVVAFFFGISVLNRKTVVAVLIVLAYMAAREADLHKALFSVSILKIRFWLDSGIPVTSKLIALAILLPIIWALLYFMAFYTLPFLAGLRARLPHAISIGMIFVVTGAAKVIDRSLNMLIEISSYKQFPVWMWTLQACQEELLECLIPFLFILAILQYRNYVRENSLFIFSRR